VRRILVPQGLLAAVQEDLVARLGVVVTGDPADPTVTMGPLATAHQLQDAERGVEMLLHRGTVRLVHGPGRRWDGPGSPTGKGYFFSPTLLLADDPDAAVEVHQREIFGPLATLLSYDGGAPRAAELVARARGTLVTSVYGDDPAWLGAFTAATAPWTGRIYVGSAGSAEAALGSGAALPQALHGGPGRAGGGQELGGLVGVRLYLQRVALQGSRDLVEGLAGT
jgi:oxepin-CoA hydrolase/3-oxo-5,6-dehydrosuberyl-CoA semialdehyde dehydrogenase